MESSREFDIVIISDAKGIKESPKLAEAVFDAEAFVPKASRSRVRNKKKREKGKLMLLLEGNVPGFGVDSDGHAILHI
jgi:hypothetical protein